MDISEADYVFLPLEEAVTPQKGGFFQHYVSAWWVVHPDRGLAFYNPRNARTGRRRHSRYGSPQCNTDERIARMVGPKTVGELWPDVRIQQFPSVWVPVDISDYRD
jgi:hypothetical protein